MSLPSVSDEDIALVAPILQQLMWADTESKRKVQAQGVLVLPNTMYSSVPSVVEIETSYEYTSAEPPYLNPQLFNAARFQTTLETLLPFAGEFAPPLAGDEDDAQRFFWQNSQFSYSDAMAYYCFVRQLRPSTIVEIGSGFSTLVALEAVAANGVGAVHCIEPYPRPFLSQDQRVVLHAQPAQAISPAFLNGLLRDGDILFIDSTHTVKTGSDCLHIYLRLLPALRRDITVHVHDVFLPFGLPQAWLLDHQIAWTEQYLLMAFLLDNPKASLVYGSAFNAAQHPDLLAALMGEMYPMGGSSVWFRYNGRG